MPTFDMVVVGAGGGPDETDLSAYLFKPADMDWSDGIVALEAGSGQGALRRILQSTPSLFGESHPTVADIYSWVHCFVLSHAHLDHINSLVISAGSFLPGNQRKHIHASKQVLDALNTHVFQDVVWPALASYEKDDDDSKYLYKEFPALKYQPVLPDVSIRRVSVSHGGCESSAFFIRHNPSSNEFLFFGDVEPDSLASKPRNLNVWALAAQKIPDKLSCIFIECSFPSGRDDDMLFGHLNPEHLVQELTVLAEEVIKARSHTRPPRKKRKKNSVDPDALRGALTGVRVVIVHCKDDLSLRRHPREIILEQVKALVEAKGLGVEVIAAEQGMHLTL
ncbi:cyclic-AMP phosphodiesterase [Hymenopellis radicata]|nr:cyclic-AMP phosphodiesterase [Hymenopellis radicata]